jgi:hypothetical protein
MSQHIPYTVPQGDGFNSGSQRVDSKTSHVPVEVVLVTQDFEICGLVHVNTTIREDRRLTELLNDPHRKFLAVTDAQIISRHSPTSPRVYPFMQLRVDTIQLMHPSAQSILRQNPYDEAASQQFDNLRDKVNSDAL